MKIEDITLNNGMAARAAGNLELLTPEKAATRYAFIGARYDVTEGTRAWIRSQMAKLDASVHVAVSGLAIGSDTITHEAAIENGVPQIAVLPSGLRNVYPRQNRRLARRILEDGGALVSLSPDKANPCRNSFLERNKAVIALSHLAVVGQFNWPSGTAQAVNQARKAGKLVVVQNANFTGNRKIIESTQFRTVQM